jgi:hypothetical protein
MNRFRWFAMSFVVISVLSHLSLADSPDWLPVTQESGAAHPLLISDSSESQSQDRLLPDEVFSGSAETLIQMSCSDAEGQCGIVCGDATMSCNVQTCQRFAGER